MITGKKTLRGILALAFAFVLVTGLFAKGTRPAVETDSRKLTYWCTLAGGIVSENFTNLGDTPFAKGLMERTGVTIEYFHPPAGGAGEQFNLIVASGDLPDLMEYNWYGYRGGPEKAISDGVIIRLNDVIARQSPHLSAFLKANPDIDKMIRTDSGAYYNYPMIRDANNRFSTVTMIRKDWLDEAGLSVPTTYDEWHNALTIFKAQKGGTPLAFESSFLLSADAIFSYGFNTRAGLYLGFDGKIHYGQIESGFRDYITLMNRWYREGLLDPDILTLNLQQVTPKMTSGTSGASIGYIGSRMGTWLPAGKNNDPRYTLVGTPVPVQRKGDTANFSPVSLAYNSAGGCVAITTACKNLEAAARLLDWGYSDEGIRYYSYGTEGVSYTMVNGAPVYTSLIVKNPNGWPMNQALGAYTRVNYNAPSIPDGNYNQQYYTYEEQKKALGFVIPAASARLVPPITPTPEESSEYAMIMSEVNTYVNEMLTRFFLGTENIANWDNYVRTVNSLGLPRALEIQNNALARYNRR